MTCALRCDTTVSEAKNYRCNDGQNLSKEHNHTNLQDKGIPAALLGVPRIEVKFDIDANEILSVTAIDKGTRKKQDITITGTNTLPSDEV
ncbi:hypothetical protein D5086_033563 [Populus alba]|uniref:Uncharacterized protein n=1 Tax=Populus alba TaxID=43335 RepID=A0ACC4AH64_POPAL